MIMIGFFDSGKGGLTTLAQCIKDGIRCEMAYYADYENAPFGDKTKSELSAIASGCLKRLKSIGADECVSACNTLSLACSFDQKTVFGLRIPFELVDDYSACLFLGTSYSVSALPKWFFQMGGKAKALTNLATLVDEGNQNRIQEYLENNLTEKCKTVIVGCTHFVFCKNEIKQLLGAKKVLTVNEGISKRLRKTKNEKSIVYLQKEKAEDYASALYSLGVSASLKTY